MLDALPTLLGGMLAGVSGGVLSGLLGVGGGFVMIPLLSLLLGMDQHRAQGTTLAIMMMPIGIPSVLQYQKNGIEWNLRMVCLIVAGFVCGVSLGSVAANAIQQTLLRLGFTAMLLCMAVCAWFRREAAGAWAEGGPTRAIVLPSLMIGAAGGVTSGLTGLGGAVVIVPLLVRWFRMTQHQAQMTSLMVLLPPIGLPGVLVYARTAGGLPWTVVLGAVAGFDLGSYLGAKAAIGMTGARLKRLYSLALLFMAGAMVWRLVLYSNSTLGWRVLINI